MDKIKEITKTVYEFKGVEFLTLKEAETFKLKSLLKDSYFIKTLMENIRHNIDDLRQEDVEQKIVSHIIDNKNNLLELLK